MRAVRLEAFGAPLVLRDRLPRPEPRAGEVLVRVEAAGVCGTDVKLWRGDIRGTPLPLTPGHETAGIVEDGPWAAELPAGTRVVALHHLYCDRCPNCLSGRENLCLSLRGRIGFDHDGGWADYLVVPERNLFPVPDGVPAAVACVVPDAVATAWRALIRVAQVAPGEGVVVIGLGGLGLSACQIARDVGAEVLAVDVAEEKLSEARRLDVERTALAEHAEEAAGTLPLGFAEVVIDCAGAPAAVDLAARLVGRGGRLVQVGYSPTATLELPTARVALDEIEVRGCRAAGRRDLSDALAAVARGVVTPLVSGVRPLEDAQATLEELAAGDVRGRQVLAPADAA